MMTQQRQTTKYFTSCCLFICFMVLVRSTTAGVDLVGETSASNLAIMTPQQQQQNQQDENGEIERRLTVHGKYFDKGTMVNPNSPSNYGKYSSSNYNSSSNRSSYNNNYNSSNNSNNRNSNTSYNSNNNSNNRNSNTSYNSNNNSNNRNSNTSYNSNNNSNNRNSNTSSNYHSNSNYNKNTSTSSNNNSKYYNNNTSSSSSNGNSYWNSSKRNLAYGGVFLTAAVAGSLFGRRRIAILRSDLEEEQESQAPRLQYDEERGNSSSTVEFVSMDSIISQSSLNSRSQDESTTTGSSSDNSWV